MLRLAAGRKLATEDSFIGKATCLHVWVTAGQSPPTALVGFSHTTGTPLSFEAFCFLAFADGFPWRCPWRASEMKTLTIGLSCVRRRSELGLQ